MVVPGLGNQHHHRVGQAVARPDQELDGVVQAGGVGEPLADDRLDLGDVARLVELGGEEGLAGPHPVDVAAQRVDLAVVRDHPVGMGQLPAREGVGGEPRVEHADRALEQRIAQVVVEVDAHLAGREHSLVDQGPAREAGEVEVLVIVEPGLLDLGLEPLADHVELALEGVGVLDPRAPAHQGVEHLRLDGPGAGAQRGVVGRERPPAQEGLALLGDDLLEDLHAELLLGRVGRGEERPHAVASRARPGRCPAPCTAATRNSWGIWIKTPAPSPVLFSQPQAPRWSRFTSAVRPSRTS